MTHYILSDSDVTALGGDPVVNPPIPGRPRMALRPEKLVGGGRALPGVALESATTEQAAVLAGCTRRVVTLDEFQWVAEAEAQP